MRKILFILSFIIVGFSLNAQTTKSDALLIEKINQLNSAKTMQQYVDVQGDFTKLLNKDRRWQVYYYAGFICLQQAKINLENGNSQIEGNLGNALKYITLIKPKQRNGEVNTLLGMVYYLKSKFDVDTQQRGLSKKESLSYYKLAQKQGCKNPRLILLGNLLFPNKSKEIHESEGNQSSISPNWGKEDLGKLIN